ncbi:MAG: D-isomer specific 2-hydroxyacid dehydrogenase family protein [Microbacteriaceae bacterium]
MSDSAAPSDMPMPQRRGTGQHKDLVATAAEALDGHRRPTPGPIAVLPESQQVFVDAVTAGGGVVAPLSPETRGLVWLSERRASELAEVLVAHPAIEWVQLPWAGVDPFVPLLSEFSERQFPVWTSAKGSYSEPVAEHALALILALLRFLPSKSRSESWAQKRIGLSLYARNVLIVGAGGISLELMRLLEPFEVSVTIVRRADAAVAGAVRTVTAEKLDDVLPEADVVVLAAASTEETAQLLGAQQFSLMKPTAVLVNIARGALVDTGALVDALASGSIAGAGLDVTDPEPLPDGHPLWGEPHCVITSHSADTADMTAPLLAARIRSNVEAFLDHGRFVGIVDPKSGY